MRGSLAGAAGVATGYLVGSVPIGVLIGRAVRGLDVREHGSHSMGTTNVLRLVGPSAAALTFALDVGKGSAAVLIARRLGASRNAQAMAGLAAVTGHCWPVLARFRGGKGVATAFGGVLVVSPPAAAFAVPGGLTALLATRIVSVGSLTAAGCAVAGAAAARARQGDRTGLWFTAAAAGLVVVRHAPNIQRLLAGTEPQASLRIRR